MHRGNPIRATPTKAASHRHRFHRQHCFWAGLELGPDTMATCGRNESHGRSFVKHVFLGDGAFIARQQMVAPAQKPPNAPFPHLAVFYNDGHGFQPLFPAVPYQTVVRAHLDMVSLPQCLCVQRGVWTMLLRKFECFASNCGICSLQKMKICAIWTLGTAPPPPRTCPMIPQTLMIRIALLHLALQLQGPVPERALTKKRRREILVRSLKTRHGSRNIPLHKHARPAAAALCCCLTWLKHVLQNLTDSWGIQHCKCLFVLDGLVRTPAPLGGRLLHDSYQVCPANEFSHFFVMVYHRMNHPPLPYQQQTKLGCAHHLDHSHSKHCAFC